MVKITCYSSKEVSEWGRKRIGVTLNVARLVYGARQDGLTLQTCQKLEYPGYFLICEILKRKSQTLLMHGPWLVTFYLMA